MSESSCVVLNYLSSTLILKLSPVVNAVLNQTKEIWRDFTRFAIISKPNIQITQNKNPVEANYIVNFFKTDIQLSQKKCSFNDALLLTHAVLYAQRVLLNGVIYSTLHRIMKMASASDMKDRKTNVWIFGKKGIHFKIRNGIMKRKLKIIWSHF